MKENKARKFEVSVWDKANWNTVLVEADSFRVDDGALKFWIVDRRVAAFAEDTWQMVKEIQT